LSNFSSVSVYHGWYKILFWVGRVTLL
jgi:hypothetical protein